MKKLLLSLMLSLILVVPAFASDVPEEPELLQAPIEYKRFYLFDAFTSGGVQFDYAQSPVTTAFQGQPLYGHVQWEHVYGGKKDGTRKYVMKILNPDGALIYKDFVEYTTWPGFSGSPWQAIAIPTAELAPGYYIMKMTVIIKTPGKTPVTKSMSSKFRIIPAL